jgi:L-serine deaminase
VESTKSQWTDERMGEFAERTEENFREVRGEIRRAESNLRGEMNQRFAHMERRFDVMLGAMITGFVGLIISHFVG